MIPRFASAGLGLLAFSISTTSGLFAGNPVEVILSRSILALFLFCVVGYLLGTAAQMVVLEHERNAGAAIKERYGNPTSDGKGSLENGTGDAEKTGG